MRASLQLFMDRGLGFLPTHSVAIIETGYISPYSS